MISDARNGHVSPGIYTEEKDVTYSVKSLGITSLGLVGETLYGPAFENIEIKNWSEFVDYFGGTSTEKFKGTGRPKYELPYIAKSYLEESNRLNVVRVLGLSGYYAGPHWIIKSGGDVVGILRSKMKYTPSEENCGIKGEKKAEAVVSSITASAYSEVTYEAKCNTSSSSGATETHQDNRHFTLTINCKANMGFNEKYVYNLSLNPLDHTYIYNVLSNRPDTGTTPVYIESLFEGSIKEGETVSVEKGTYAESGIVTYCDISKDQTKASSYTLTISSSINEDDITSANTIDLTNKIAMSGNSVTVELDPEEIGDKSYARVKKTSDGLYDDYREGYRAAATPWIVSDAVVTNTSASVKKLFRFITVSDGNIANYQVKVSIQNIDPIQCIFDVVVRDFYDRDDAPIILERFSRCNLVEGDVNYIAYRIGTSDGGFVAKSKYILVEMAKTEDLSNNVPAGFLGYPIPKYGNLASAEISYNTKYHKDIKPKKQYFGFSSINGIETDFLSYKGLDAYLLNANTTKGFHMDSLVSAATVDGSASGVQFTTVSSELVSSDKYVPRLVNISNFLEGSIYKDIKTRKFTVCFYGGFDGWDVNRESRTNTDNFKASVLDIGNGDVFTRYGFGNEYTNMNLPLNLPSTAITSDYYAYLAGFRKFSNPQDVDINLFATPGIDWFNNTYLTEEAIDVIEDVEEGRGGDALYIMSSPNELTAEELSEAFEGSDISSSYACTYAPWIMHYDSSNKKYLTLPVTKDVVRNMASTDNKSYPWFAPAGMERGNVNCIKAEYKTTLADEDKLYESRINPVKTFAQDGVKIWGNKTAYNSESPLNRINVRRLMIRVKKLVTSAAKNLIFTQYDDTLEKQFKSIIDPILADVKANRGISDYRLITEITPEAKDQHILPAKILIKPTPALEYISLSFVVYPESVSFDEN